MISRSHFPRRRPQAYNYGIQRENLQPHCTAERRSLLCDLQDRKFRERPDDLFQLLREQNQVSVGITTIIGMQSNR